MIRTKPIEWLPVVGLLLVAAACSSSGVKNSQHVPVTGQNKRLNSAIVADYPAFVPQVMGQTMPFHHASADFNNDGLVDEALVLSDGSKWKLIVFLQTRSGTYSSKEITTFPGADSLWKTMPAYKVRIYPIAGKGVSADRLGCAIDGMTGSLEYSWSEKNRDFAASRVHADVPVSATFRGKVILRALDLDKTRSIDSCPNAASCFDLDQELTGNGKTADLALTKGRGTMTFYALVPINGALAAPFGKSVPTYDDCRLQQDAMSDGSMPELEPGMHFCVLSNEKNFAHVWIQSIDPGHESFTLGFEIWSGGYR